MVQPKRKEKLTVRDYMSMPDDGRRFELIDGELIFLPTPYVIHQMIIGELIRVLGAFEDSRDIGRVYISPLDVVLSEHDVLQPDVFFISKKRLHIVGELNIQGAPDLVIEVLSPDTEERDRGIKRDLYLRFGVREYWIIDPANITCEVLRAGDTEFEIVRVYVEGTTATSNVLEGIQVEVDRLFA